MVDSASGVRNERLARILPEALGALHALIEKHRINITLGVPSMLAAIAEEQHANPRDVSSLEVLIHGGSPIATEVVRRSCSAFPTTQLIEVYGATETSPLVALLGNEETLMDDLLARSCGRAVVGCSVGIKDADGSELPRGEVGEVVVCGTNVMKGYWNKEVKSAAVKSKDDSVINLILPTGDELEVENNVVSTYEFFQILLSRPEYLKSKTLQHIIKDASLKAPPSLQGVVIDKKLFTRSVKDKRKRNQDKHELDALEKIYDEKFDALKTLLVEKLFTIVNGKTCQGVQNDLGEDVLPCLLYTSPSPRDRTRSRMPSSA